MPDRSLRATLLLVEDDLFIQRELANRLRDGGLIVHAESSVDGALRSLTAAPPDLVLADTRLPRADGDVPTRAALVEDGGLELARHCRSSHPHVGIALMSAAPTQGLRDWCSQNGARFFRKDDIAERSTVEEIRRIAQDARRHRLDSVIDVLRRFGPFVHRVSGARQRSGTPFSVADEYDVQELLEHILIYENTKYVREEPGASTIGVSSRVDFALHDLRSAIEVKYISQGVSGRKLWQQLLDDSVKYRQLGNCDAVVFLLFDPDRKIRDVGGICREIENLSDREMLFAAVVSQ